MAREQTLFAAAILLVSLAWPPPVRAAQMKPNVLFIAVDDLNTQVGCYGSDFVKTPHLDRLAARGVRFDRAYCNYPTCNGSRTALLTGRYPESNGVFRNRTNPREKLPDSVFLPEYFKRHGYFTAAIGKITHGEYAPALRCDEIVDIQRLSRKQRPDIRGDLPFNWEASRNSDSQAPDGMIARKAVELLEKRQHKPFFIAVGFHRPHVPHAAPRKYFEMYPSTAMKRNDRGGADGVPSSARNRFYPELTAAQQRQIVAHYSAVTTFMDSQLGVVLEAVGRLGLSEKTIVVFWSDHGWHLGDHGGMWAKGTVMEEAARIPLIIVAPGKATGASQRVVETVDLYPTLAVLCGLPVPAEVQGRSFAKLLDDPGTSLGHTAYTVKQRRDGLSRSIRDYRYMYAEYPDGARQLYDLVNDPHQLHNLADDQAHAKAKARMQRLLHEKKQARRQRG